MKNPDDGAANEDAEASSPLPSDAAGAADLGELANLGDLGDLIRRARGGDGAALDELLRLARPLLRRIAQRRLGRRLMGRLDPSDIVQQTLLEAHRDIGRFQGGGRAELLAWLQCILTRNMASAVRTHLFVQRRAVGRELPLDDSQGGGGVVRRRLALDQTSPSQRLLRNEKVLRLLHLLGQLPADQRQAVRLRHLEGYTLEEIAQIMERTPMAAASLIKRGMETLRRRYRDPE